MYAWSFAYLHFISLLFLVDLDAYSAYTYGKQQTLEVIAPPDCTSVRPQ
jgi:hypothetical protein